MDTKAIGNIGEAKVLCKFVELGIPVYIPFGDNEKADFIAEFNGKLNKIQVKTAIGSKDGVITFSLVSSTMHNKNGVNHIYTNDEIDYFACYSIERDKIYLISINDAPTTAINIRYSDTKNKQKKNIKLEEEYLIDNVLCVENLHETPKD